MNWKPEIHCDEEKIVRTVQCAKEAFYEGEAARPLRRWEFLMQQSSYIKKRWWVLQGVLLAAVWMLLRQSDSSIFSQRSLGAAAPLFVLLALPELWKNRSCGAVEVEGTTLYTLRQIYAARLILFAGVDLTLLSLFFLGASGTGVLTLWDLMIQFLLPFNVSCFICFSCLYNPRHVSQSFSLLLCGVWTGAWELLTLDDNLYLSISVPLWRLLLAASFAALGFSVLLGQRNWKRTWEVKPVWN